MTLEEEINRTFDYSVSIEDWKWKGEPHSLYWTINPLIEEALRVERLIQEASLVLCLTSPSQYIREYRKWFERNKE